MRYVAIACTGLAVGLIMSLSGCATPMEPRPIAGRAQTMPLEQASAECRFEVEKAIAGEQNLGIILHIQENVMGSCMAAKGFEMVPVGG